MLGGSPVRFLADIPLVVGSFQILIIPFLHCHIFLYSKVLLLVITTIPTITSTLLGNQSSCLSELVAIPTPEINEHQRRRRIFPGQPGVALLWRSCLSGEQRWLKVKGVHSSLMSDAGKPWFTIILISHELVDDMLSITTVH